MNIYLNKIIGIFFIALCAIVIPTYSQNIDIDKMSKDEILSMDYDQLLEMPFEDLLKLSDKVGVSSEDLLAMLMNRDVKSASKKAESSLESPLSTTVLTREEILRSGARNIPEALRLAPGVIVREKTTGNYDVHIRGNDNMPNKHLMFYSENSISLIMIDGRPVFNYAHGGTFWETLPINILDVDRIEVIRGPASALYGPNAVSGAINIITRVPQGTKVGFNADVQGGTQSTIIGNANLDIPISNQLKIRASGYYHKMDRHNEDYFVWYKPKGAYVPYDSLGKTPNPSRNGMPYVGDYDERVSDPSMAQDRYAANVFLNYKPNAKVGVDLSAGMQNSLVGTSLLDNSYAAMSERLSDTKYLDVRGNAYGFNAQVSYLTGTQNAARGNEGYTFDLNTLHALLEYDWNLGKLNLRPGISFQQASYDDSDYVNASINQGIFNGKRTLSNFSASLRADYRPTEKLRFIAALRAEKYSNPDKTYPTYQFVGSYKVSENHLVRAVYSRANRGPFMSDIYTSFDWPFVLSDFNGILPEEIPVQLVKYRGNEELELMKMDMFEVGFRNKLTKNLFSDIEIFYTKSSDYGYFVAQDYQFEMPNPGIPSALLGVLPPEYLIKHLITYQYGNLPMVSEQLGATLSFDLIANSKFQLKAYGTVQKTNVTNYLDRNPDQSLVALLQSKYNEATDAQSKMLYAAVLLNVGVPMEGIGIETDDLIDVEHKTTPSFYGGFTANYTPIKRLNLNANIYYLGDQEFIFQHENDYIDQKTILNFKADYKIWKENSIYFNARNILNQDHNEFMFMDKIGAQYLVGVHLNF